jgi:hypothetical protein
VYAEPLIDELLLLRYEGLVVEDASDPTDKNKKSHVRCELLLATGDIRGVTKLICNCQSPATRGACHRCGIVARHRIGIKIRKSKKKKETKKKDSENKRQKVSNDDVSTMTVMQLKEKCKEMGLAKYSTLRKDKLVTHAHINCIHKHNCTSLIETCLFFRSN